MFFDKFTYYIKPIFLFMMSDWVRSLSKMDREIVFYIVQNIDKGLCGLAHVTVADISREVNLPIEMVGQSIYDLEAEGRIRCNNGIIWVKDVLSPHNIYPPRITLLIKKEIETLDNQEVQSWLLEYYSRLLQNG